LEQRQRGSAVRREGSVPGSGLRARVHSSCRRTRALRGPGWPSPKRSRARRSSSSMSRQRRRSARSARCAWKSSRLVRFGSRCCPVLLLVAPPALTLASCAGRRHQPERLGKAEGSWLCDGETGHASRCFPCVRHRCKRRMMTCWRACAGGGGRIRDDSSAQQDQRAGRS